MPLNKKINELNRKIVVLSASIETKNTHLISYQKEVERLLGVDEAEKNAGLQKLNSDMKKHMEFDMEYDIMKVHFDEIFPSFYQSLFKRSDKLTHRDMRLAAFIKMHLNNKEIAFMLNLSHNGVKKAIQRFRKKLKLEKDTDLRAFIASVE